jgi:hypothetical protein
VGEGAHRGQSINPKRAVPSQLNGARRPSLLCHRQVPYNISRKVAPGKRPIVYVIN